MEFFRKLKFWKKRNSYSLTKLDARTCGATTVTVDPTVISAAHTETRMDVGVYAANSDYERELDLKNQKIRKLEEELAVSKGLTAEATSDRNTKVNCGTQTQANSMQRDCANAVEQETVRRLMEENGRLSELAEECMRLIVLLHEESKDYEEEIRAQLCKIRNMTDEIASLKEGRTPPTEKDTEDHQQNRGSDDTGCREAGENNNGQESSYLRHRPNRFVKNRNIPPRRQQTPFMDKLNWNARHHRRTVERPEEVITSRSRHIYATVRNMFVKKRNMPPRRQQNPFMDKWNIFHGQATTSSISLPTSFLGTISQLFAPMDMLC